MFHCLVIKVVSLSALCDSLFRLSYSEELVKNFFNIFSNIFRLCICYFPCRSKPFSSFSDLFQKDLSAVIFLSVLTTCLLYHKFSRLSTVNLNILKSYLLFCILEAISCDSLFNIPLPQGIVKHFFKLGINFRLTHDILYPLTKHTYLLTQIS